MTEADRSTWGVDERAAHQRELAERRQAWEEQRKAQEEQQARQEKQERLSAWLTARSQAWMDYTGQVPTPEQLAEWQSEYVTQRAAEEEVQREFARAAAEDIAGL